MHAKKKDEEKMRKSFTHSVFSIVLAEVYPNEVSIITILNQTTHTTRNTREKVKQNTLFSM